MLIYKVFSCSKCKEILELQYDETEETYIGTCKRCKREVKTEAVGDERDIIRKGDKNE